MTSVILNPNNEILYLPDNIEPEIAYTPTELLSVIRKKKYDFIFLVDSNEITESFIKSVFARSYSSSILFFSDDVIEFSDKVSMLIDRIIPITMTENDIEDLNELILSKYILDRSNIYGKSQTIYNIGSLIQRISHTNLSVLITGESGAGKEVISKAIHMNSLRATKPFLAVNCGAIPESLLEAELFGHKKGAFTGAVGQREGYFKRANNGTIFLDEIGELPLSSQVKLLRILETGSFFPVGSSTAESVDVRIIAATNLNVKEAVSEGKFREDLYYRLGVVNIYIPPLRERQQDLLVLILKFKDDLEQKMDRKFSGFTDEALNGIMNYHFPGNVRELKNLVENSLILADKRKVTYDDLRGYFNAHQDIGRNLPIVKQTEEHSSGEIYRILGFLATELRDIRKSIDEINNKLDNTNNLFALPENERILEALARAGGNKTHAAELLGISRRTLYRHLEKYGIE